MAWATLAGPVFVQVADDDGRPFAGEALGDGAPDPGPPAPADDGHLPCQSHQAAASLAAIAWNGRATLLTLPWRG